jgi:hypothetical protein
MEFVMKTAALTEMKQVIKFIIILGLNVFEMEA